MLNYIGDGTAIVGIPARDLTDDEVAQLEPWQVDALVASGLYAKPAVSKAGKTTGKPADLTPATDGQQEA
jgi:hypothetical protein